MLLGRSSLPMGISYIYFVIWSRFFHHLYQCRLSFLVSLNMLHFSIHVLKIFCTCDRKSRIQGKYEHPSANMVQIMFTGGSGSFSEIGLGYFFAFFAGLAINYYGMFYIWMYFVKP